METFILLSTITILLGSCATRQSFGASAPVYGFSGAASATTSGRTLHYTVHLHKCRQLSGPADPEFAVTFGGHVATWRSFNDRDISPIPFMTFYDQKPVYNNTGHLAQLSREILLWGNDTAIVTSYIYSADLSRETYGYSHQCSMTSQTVKGDIDLVASTELPMPLYTFEDMVAALEAGVYVHFTAMTFLCPGGEEHTFSTFGGHIPNYDIVYDDDALVEIRTSVQQITHFDERDNIGVLDVINMSIFSNRTVDIYDNLGVPPEMQRVAVRTARCYLAAGMPGGMVHVWGRPSSTANCY